MFDINNFKSNSKKELRKWMNNLFSIQGYLGATDGRILAIDLNSLNTNKDYIPTIEENLKKNNLNLKVDYILENINNYNWKSLPQRPKEDAFKNCFNCDDGKEFILGDECEECEGEGTLTLESNINTYEVECKSCESEGFEILGKRNCEYCNGTLKTLNFVESLYEFEESDKYFLNEYEIDKFRNFENAKLTWCLENKFFVVKFDGGLAIIFPSRK